MSAPVARSRNAGASHSDAAGSASSQSAGNGRRPVLVLLHRRRGAREPQRIIAPPPADRRNNRAGRRIDDAGLSGPDRHPGRLCGRRGRARSDALEAPVGADRAGAVCAEVHRRPRSGAEPRPARGVAAPAGQRPVENPAPGVGADREARERAVAAAGLAGEVLAPAGGRAVAVERAGGPPTDPHPVERPARHVADVSAVVPQHPIAPWSSTAHTSNQPALTEVATWSPGIVGGASSGPVAQEIRPAAVRPQAIRVRAETSANGPGPRSGASVPVQPAAPSAVVEQTTRPRPPNRPPRPPGRRARRGRAAGSPRRRRRQRGRWRGRWTGAPDNRITGSDARRPRCCARNPRPRGVHPGPPPRSGRRRRDRVLVGRQRRLRSRGRRGPGRARVPQGPDRPEGHRGHPPGRGPGCVPRGQSRCGRRPLAAARRIEAPGWQLPASLALDTHPLRRDSTGRALAPPAEPRYRRRPRAGPGGRRRCGPETCPVRAPFVLQRFDATGRWSGPGWSRPGAAPPGNRRRGHLRRSRPGSRAGAPDPFRRIADRRHPGGRRCSSGGPRGRRRRAVGWQRPAGDRSSGTGDPSPELDGRPVAANGWGSGPVAAGGVAGTGSGRPCWSRLVTRGVRGSRSGRCSGRAGSGPSTARTGRRRRVRPTGRAEGAPAGGRRARTRTRSGACGTKRGCSGCAPPVNRRRSTSSCSSTVGGPW